MKHYLEFEFVFPKIKDTITFFDSKGFNYACIFFNEKHAFDLRQQVDCGHPFWVKHGEGIFPENAEFLNLDIGESQNPNRFRLAILKLDQEELEVVSTHKNVRITLALKKTMRDTVYWKIEVTILPQLLLF